MDHFMEYWFYKYDNESFEREFSKVQYMDILSHLIVDPDFKNLPNEPPTSNNKGIQALQECCNGIMNSLVNFFSSLNLDPTHTDRFSRWVRTVLAYLDCEKLYGIIFWNLTFIPNFVECRVNASLVRYYKFLMSFCQGILSQEGVQQLQNMTGDGGRKMNIVIKRVVELNPQKGILVDWRKTLRLQKDILDELKKVKQHTPTLAGKIYHYTYHMFDKSMSDLKKECDQLFGNLETQWVQRILQENNLAIEHLDNYLEEQDKQMVDDFKEDEDMFERSQTIQDILKQTEVEYLPDDLKKRLYGIQGETLKEDQEKATKRLMIEKLQKKALKKKLLNEKLEQDYQERYRNERELVTAGTMVTQASSQNDFQPRKIKSQIADELNGESGSKKEEVLEQSRFQKYSESDTYKNSPNNPQNMKGSVVAFLANDVFQPYYEEQDKKQKKNDDQQKRIEKQKNQREESANQSIALLSTATATSSQGSQQDQNQISSQLRPELLNYIHQADQDLVNIKDEDIVFDDGRKKRKFIQQKKKNPNDPSLNSLSEFDSPDITRKVTANQYNSSEILDEGAKRAAAKKLLKEQNQAALSRLQQSRIDEKPSDEVRDTDLFQYSYENSLDEDDMEEDEDKQKRINKFQEKVPMPKNFAHPQDGILFQKFRDWMADSVTSKAQQNSQLRALFKINKNTLQISSKTAIPVYEQHRWLLFNQTFLYQKLEKDLLENFDEDQQRETVRKLQQVNRSKNWSNNTCRQVF